MQWVAERHVVFVFPGGVRKPGRIALAAPTRGENRCACQIALDGLERSVAIFGQDTLQALLLAARFIGWRLHAFLEQGGRILGEDSDEDAALDVTFGDLLRAAPTPS